MSQIAASKPVSPVSQTKSRARTRYWEIDAWRGIAVVTMIIYHLSWDLWFFGALPGLDPFHGWLKALQQFTAVSFITLAGLSVAVADQRFRRDGVPRRSAFRYFLRRGAMIFGWGIVITVIMAVSGVGMVHFGVLHLIGFSIIAVFPFLQFRWLNILLWALFQVANLLIAPIRLASLWLVWLGFDPPGYGAVDYFPLIPWFGVALLGVGLGNLLYTTDGFRFALPDLSRTPIIRVLRFLGSHSLTIYLIHQPVLFALLWLVGVAR